MKLQTVFLCHAKIENRFLKFYFVCFRATYSNRILVQEDDRTGTEKIFSFDHSEDNLAENFS